MRVIWRPLFSLSTVNTDERIWFQTHSSSERISYFSLCDLHSNSSAFKDDLCHLGQWESFPYKQWLWMKFFLKVWLYRDVWKLKSFTSTKLSSFPVDISKPFLAASLFRSWHSRTAALFFSSSDSSWDQKHSGSGHLWSSSPRVSSSIFLMLNPNGVYLSRVGLRSSSACLFALIGRLLEVRRVPSFPKWPVHRTAWWE